MSTDRLETLRHAEKLLRQGTLQQAIDAYARAVEEQPRDWSTANLLGDLHLRAGEPEQAIAQFTRIADILSLEGFLPKALALYKKVLKVKPDDAYALGQVAELSAQQGLLVDARVYLRAVCELHRSRGDASALAAAEARVAALDQGGDRGEVQVAGGPARFIAEDLMAREPTDPSHVDRLRRALTMLGDGDPESAIARARSLEGFDTLGTVHGSLRGPDALPGALPTPEVTAERPTPAPRPPPTQSEIDLTVKLDDITPAPWVVTLRSKDLEGVFAELRDEAARVVGSDAAGHDLQQGLALWRAGQLQEATAALERAAKAPHIRFAAASALAGVCRERGQAWPAIEWLERAAQAPAPAPEEGHRLLYQLADSLEAVGEVARALAVCLELRSVAGDYQDVALRVERLAHQQARG